MMIFGERQGYEQRLRQIVLYSADALPEMVAAYLKEVAESGHEEVKKEVLKEFRALVDYLAKDYVDFALEVLIAKPKKRRTVFSDIYDDLYDPELGMDKYLLDCFPSSPIQGPFLYLLRQNEDEGLRLIQTLGNTAVARWREYLHPPYSSEYSLTPLPTPITLSSEVHNFWGDEQVYYWYRPNGNGSEVVKSALMALEVWMEEQIEAGTDPEELFEKVLTGSQCVAVLGICVGMGLAYPDKCLKAALPLVSSPRVWFMDVRRSAADMIPSFAWDPLGRDKPIYELQAERDKRPQRSRSVRFLSMPYLFLKDHSLRVSFEQALASFTEDLPFFYEEQRDDPEEVAALRKEMEDFQLCSDRKNYRGQETEAGIQIQFEAPEPIRERNEADLAPILEEQRWFSIDAWAQKTMKEGKAAEWLTLEQAVAEAREFQRPNDFAAVSEQESIRDDIRLQAIAGVAAAVLVTDFQWTQEQDLVGWCCNVLLAAARLSSYRHSTNSRRTIFPSNPKVSAGLGLGALIAHRVGGIEVRKLLLQLVADPQLQVLGAVFLGLYDAWTVDEVLCWNALSLSLSLGLLPRTFVPRGYEAARAGEEAQWAHEIIQRHMQNLQDDVLPDPPRIKRSKDVVFLWDSASRALGAFPLPALVEKASSKARLLQLAGDLMDWTINENRPAPDDPYGDHVHGPYEWNLFFLRWTASLARFLTLEEIQEYVFVPVRSSWPYAPQLTANLLYGYLEYHLAYIEPLTVEAQEGWREICAWVLDSPELAEEARGRYLDGDISDAVSRMLYVFYGAGFLKSEWPHAALFLDVAEKWVKVIGFHPSAFGNLLTMLEGPGWTFTPEPALEWLSHCVNLSADIQRFVTEHNNGDRTAQLLLRMWNSFEEQIRRNPDSLQKYSSLVDRLVAMGVPLAGILQQKLEQLG